MKLRFLEAISYTENYRRCDGFLFANIVVFCPMNNLFFERPILNSPYEVPRRYWELDAWPEYCITHL